MANDKKSQDSGTGNPARENSSNTDTPVCEKESTRDNPVTSKTPATARRITALGCPNQTHLITNDKPRASRITALGCPNQSHLITNDKPKVSRITALGCPNQTTQDPAKPPSVKQGRMTNKQILAEQNSITLDLVLPILRFYLRKCRGLDILTTVCGNPNHGIHVTRLRQLNSKPSVHAAEFDTNGEAQPGYISTDHSLPELPIPYTDSLTLEQAKRAYLQLIDLESEALINNDFAKGDEIREEREKFEDYFRQVVTRKGKIRNIQDRTHEDYRVIKANLDYMLKKVRALNPTYAKYIEQHLIIKYFVVWRER